jgi:hypothetical protein
MSVRWDGSLIRLIGDCRVEDAEALVTMLQTHGGAPVDLSEAAQIHTAVVQVLLAATPALRGTSRDSFVRTWIEPLLNQARTGPAEPLRSNELD